MAKKFISRAIFVLFVIALAAVPVAMVFLPLNATKQKTALAHDTQLLAKLQQIELTITPTLSPTQEPLTELITVTSAPANPTVTPTLTSVTKKPVYIASIIQSDKVSTWTMYQSGSMVGAAFSFTYPKTWNITYKSDDTLTDVYHFMFNQPNGSQIMTIQLYPYASSPKAFIAANYNNKLDAEEFGAIGDTNVYRLSPKNTIRTDDAIYTTFGSRGLILGKKYAYTISFDSNPDHAMINLIEQIIWPTFTFK